MKALGCGIPPDDFWGFSFDEIIDVITAQEKRKVQEMENQRMLRAVMDYQLAMLVAMGVNNPKKLPRTPEEAYPGVFKSPESNDSEEDWRLLKARMAAYGNAYAIRQRGGGNA